MASGSNTSEFLLLRFFKIPDALRLSVIAAECLVLINCLCSLMSRSISKS